MADFSKGWVTLLRSIQENWVWKTKPFSKGQAWVDLILSANHKDNKVLINGNLREVKRSQFITSQVKLAERWGWNRKTVTRFLSGLKVDEMLDITTDNACTMLTIINYNNLQKNTKTDMDSGRDSEGTAVGTAKGQRSGHKQQCNNGNNETKDIKNGERTVKQPLEEKKKNFFSPAQEYFYLKYKEKTGKEYVADFAKDGKIFKELSKVIVDIQQFKEVINRFFNSEDEFIIKAGYTVGVFRTQINKLQMDIIPHSELRKEFGLK